MSLDEGIQTDLLLYENEKPTIQNGVNIVLWNILIVVNNFTFPKTVQLCTSLE